MWWWYDDGHELAVARIKHEGDLAAKHPFWNTLLLEKSADSFTDRLLKGLQ